MPFTPVQLPSGRYQGGFRHPVTRRKITKTFDYDYEAEAWAIIEEQRAAGQDREAAAEPPKLATPAAWLGPTIADYGRAYLDRRAGLLAKKTRDKYSSHLAGLAKPVGKTGALSNRHIGTLKKAEVEQWITDSVKAGVGAPTINARIALLRQFYADLIADDDAPVHRDPTHGIKKLTEDISDRRTLSPAEEPVLLAAADDQLRLAMLVGLDAGLRWEEVYALRPEALLGGDSGADYISVTQVVDGRELRAYPKGKRKRVVPTTDRLARALAAAAEGRRRTQLLFTAPHGGLENYDNWAKRTWARTLHKAGLAERIEVPTGRVRKTGPAAGQPIMQARYAPEFGFHSLRHTYGSRLAALGVPRSEIAILMGHADERTTAPYIHAGEDGRRLTLVRDVLKPAA